MKTLGRGYLTIHSNIQRVQLLFRKARVRYCRWFLFLHHSFHSQMCKFGNSMQLDFQFSLLPPGQERLFSSSGLTQGSNYALFGHSFIWWKLDILTFRVLLSRPKILYPSLVSCSASAAFFKQTKFGKEWSSTVPGSWSKQRSRTLSLSMESKSRVLSVISFSAWVINPKLDIWVPQTDW